MNECLIASMALRPAELQVAGGGISWGDLDGVCPGREIVQIQRHRTGGGGRGADLRVARVVNPHDHRTARWCRRGGGQRHRNGLTGGSGQRNDRVLPGGRQRERQWHPGRQSSRDTLRQRQREAHVLLWILLSLYSISPCRRKVS